MHSLLMEDKNYAPGSVSQILLRFTAGPSDASSNELGSHTDSCVFNFPYKM